MKENKFKVLSKFIPVISVLSLLIFSSIFVFADNEEKENVILGGPGTSYYYTYKETSKRVDKSSGFQRASAIVHGPMEVSVSRSISATESFTASIALDSSMKSKIRGGASFEWNISKSSNSSESYTVTIESGKTGYIGFKPYYNVSIGKLYRHHDTTGKILNTYSITAKSPKELGGYLDGEYKRIYQ